MMSTSTLTEFSRDGLTFDVIDTGPRDGDPVILLHGFPERASSWEQVAARLHEAGLRTLAVDQRGYSPRARPRRVRDYRTTELADDVAVLAELLHEQTGRRPHLVGHDWGSAVAWTLAMRHPDLIRSLTAVSVPHPGAFLRSEFTSTQFLKSWYFVPFTAPFVMTALARRPRLIDPMLRRFGMTPAEVARFHTGIVGYGVLPYGLHWYRAMALADRGLLAEQVRVPTTLVWSDGDVAVGRHGVEGTAARMAPEADYRLVVLEGVTHWIPTQAPEPLAAAILARVAAS
ncbi:alpha/beta fold hydrolase [Nocardioides fonticola]|uniref:Alpha/beta fold hydrolase n=1 Tax=Nocardioides fonticola TaxID=450363 RepID=A0ABP7XHM7_9ACTN